MSAPSDDRWLKRESYSKSWDERTMLMARMIRRGEWVLELGCGLMALKQYLPPDCYYTPSDQSDKFGAVLVFDINSGNIPAIAQHDVAFMGGVLEYVDDVPRIIKILSRHVQTFVVSYAPAYNQSPENIEWRKSNGWVNHYSPGEFTDIFWSLGGKITQLYDWHGQILFRFEIGGDHGN